MDKSNTKIAIIGAGPSGLAQLRAFALLESKGEKIPEIVCFEKQSDWGGMWNFTWRTGLDEHGEPVHASMYRNLWTNAPKEFHEYGDYTFDRHFSKPIPSFVPRETFRDYIIGRAKDSDILRHIQFNTVVRSVEFDTENDNFSVRAENLTTGKSFFEKFNYVIVAVGHFSVPNIPDFEGIETFPGRIIHSHDFRDARHFTGQRILIIGGALSAEDIALQTLKYGAGAITASYRKKRFNYKWPKEIEEKFLLTKIEGKTVYFPDGTTRDIDSIIYCTGYKHHFPFLSEGMRLNVTKNSSYPDQLYKGIFFNDQPRLIYLGMQELLFSSPTYDAQAWYARDTILGRIVLPNSPEREADMEVWKTRKSAIKALKDFIDFYLAYIKDLAEATKCPTVDLDKIRTDAEAFMADKGSSIIHFRDKAYTSTITGTTALPSDTPWMDIMDASVTSFL